MEPSLILQSQDQPPLPLTHYRQPSQVLAPSPKWELPEVRDQVEPPVPARVPSAQHRPDTERASINSG